MYGERTPYIHRHVVCVCVYVSQSKRENHPFPQEGGWEIEWPYIHKGETILFHRGGGAGSPSSTVRGGDAAGSRAQNRGGGGRGCRRSRGISCSTGGARGEYTVTFITY